LFDADTPGELSYGEKLRSISSKIFASPFGIKSVEFKKTGVVVGLPPTLSNSFDRMHGALKFNLAAKRHFVRYGRRAKLKLDQKYSLFHATHPIPLVLSNCPNIYTIHDLIPLRLPFTTLDNKRYYL